MQNIPKLRFPEFKNAPEWEEKTLDKLGKLISGLTYSPDDVRSSGLLVLRSSNIQNGKIKLTDNVYVREDIKGANLSKPDDILICVRNGSKALIGKNAILPSNMPISTHGAFMTVFRSNMSKFVFQLFQTDAYEKQVNADLGATINSINGSQFLKYKFIIPLLLEQQKIADCLSSLDEIILAQSEKVEALKTHKKALMQQLFPCDGESVPRLRFLEFKDAPEWEEKKLGNIAKKLIKKNKNLEFNLVLTNSAINGIVSQRDYFDKDIANKDNLNVYYIVDKDDFIYNPRLSNNAPVGSLKRNKLEKGIMSPLYMVFRFEEGNFLFFEYYFETTLWHEYMNSIANIGVKFDRLNISSEQFFNLPIQLPSLPEQQKIADCLSSLDGLILAQSEKVRALKTHKKALMQQLFPANEIKK